MIVLNQTMDCDDFSRHGVFNKTIAQIKDLNTNTNVSTTLSPNHSNWVGDENALSPATHKK